MRRLRSLGFTVRFAALPADVPWVMYPPLRLIIFATGLTPSRYRTLIRQALAAIPAAGPARPASP